MLCVRFLVLIISAAFVIDSLKTDVSSNKFDVQAMGSIRGLAGQNGFGDVASKSAFATSFVATPFYNCGKSSWGLAGSKSSNVNKSNSTYDYGILEENGFWNAAGLFFGFVQPDFLLPGQTQKDVADNVGGNHDMSYSTLLYYAPKDYELVTGVVYKSDPTAAGIHKGLGRCPSDAAILLGDMPLWDNAHYRNFYQAFLKNVGIADDKLGEYSQVTDITAPSAGGTAPAPTVYPSVGTNIRNALMPEDYSYAVDREVNGQIILNPYLRKAGCRFACSVAPYAGITFNARVGVVDLRVNATARDAVASSAAYPIAASYTMLTSVLADLGATLDDYHQQGLEDAYLSVTAGQGLCLGGKADSASDLIVYPFVSGGVWVPTSRNYAAAEGNKYCLYVPLGNEGHTGYTVSGGVSLDFKDVLCLTLGAGATVFDTISMKDYRMPNHKAQRGFYPFKIDVSRKKGRQYYSYLSLKSINCEEGVSFYCDFVYSKHKHDAIALCDSSSRRNELFEQGRLKMEAESAWSALECNFGLVFTFSENVQGGLAFMTNIKGVALPSMRTLCGSGIFTF